MVCKTRADHQESSEAPPDHEGWLEGLQSPQVSVRKLKPLSDPERKAEELAESYLKAGVMASVLVLQLFETLEEVKQLFSRASRRQPTHKASSWATGVFTHGGISGLRDGTKRLPAVTRFLAKFAKEVMGAKQFGAVAIQRNGGGRAHRDFHNFPGVRSWLCPLTGFEGGGLWTELDDMSEDNGELDIVEKEVKPGHRVKGRIIEAVKDKTFSFDPRKWHEVQPSRGERIMVIAYTPRLSNLSESDSEHLKKLGFSHYGEEEEAFEDCGLEEGYFGETEDLEVTPEGLDSSLTLLNETHCQILEDLQERSKSLRLLLEEEQILAEDLRQARNLVEDEANKVQDCISQMYQRATETLSECDKAVLKVGLKAASESTEPDYEQLLEELEGDLQVVHTVPLSQVRPVVHRWHAAIRKEFDNLVKGGTLEEISRAEARSLERQGLLRLVPSKSVFTLKPSGSGDQSYKREYRLVLCGNFVAPEEQFGSLYAGGASAETFRTVLAIAGPRGVLGARADITGAFLLAPWPAHLHRYAVVPPRLLIDQDYVSQDTYWLVRRPLYGLRESPAIWAAYRSTRLSQAKILYKNRHVVLRVSKVDPELWFIFYDNEEDLLGCIITYVDDLFYVSEKDVVVAVHAWVVEEWPCSALEWAYEGTRYLGMEVFQRESGDFEVHQRGSILDLLRSHDLHASPATQLPCPREWVADDIPEEPESFAEEELRFGQRCVGELLCLTMRTRPDLQFVVQHLAQWVSKHPRRVARVAKRVLSYLVATLNLKLVLGGGAAAAGSRHEQNAAAADGSHKLSAQENPPKVAVVGYSDSSFAPYGSRSYGASVVTVLGSPVAWKSGKQAMIALSTMESELLEATNAVTLLESVGCLLDEIYRQEYLGIFW